MVYLHQKEEGMPKRCNRLVPWTTFCSVVLVALNPLRQSKVHLLVITEPPQHTGTEVRGDNVSLRMVLYFERVISFIAYSALTAFERRELGESLDWKEGFGSCVNKCPKPQRMPGTPVTSVYYQLLAQQAGFCGSQSQMSNPLHGCCRESQSWGKGCKFCTTVWFLKVSDSWAV